MKSNKIKTGVPGLDEIFRGGMREKSSVLIAGGPGSGKTILCMQFLAEGAKNGESGLCILYDAEKEEFLEYADFLGIPLRRYEKNGLVYIVRQPTAFKKVISMAGPLGIIRNKKIKRVVVDSLTMYTYIHVGQEKDYRKEIITLLENMKGVTLMATCEGQNNGVDSVKFDPEYFLFGGLVHLAKIRSGATYERVLQVSKMKGQEHLLDIFPMSIGQGGIKVYLNQLPFSLISADAARSTKERNGPK